MYYLIDCTEDKNVRIDAFTNDDDLINFFLKEFGSNEEMWPEILNRQTVTESKPITQFNGVIIVNGDIYALARQVALA